MGLKMFQCAACGWRMPETAATAIARHAETHALEQKPVDIDEMIDNAARGIPTPQATAIDRLAAFQRIMTMPPEEVFTRLFQKPILEELDRLEKGELDDPRT